MENMCTAVQMKTIFMLINLLTNVITDSNNLNKVPTFLLDIRARTR